MKIAIEEFYNIIEALIITVFISAYFERKKHYNKYAVYVSSFALILCANTMTTIFEPSPFLTLFIVVLLITAILEHLFEGSLGEHILIAITSFMLLLLTDTVVFTLMSNIFSIKYADLVRNDGLLRFLTVITVKTLYIIIAFIIVSFKKKRPIFLHKLEYINVLATLLVSIIMMIMVRNIIYVSSRNYKMFLIITLCLLFINICQYYTMIYISNKNMNEQKLSLMKMQLEMQEGNIHNLEEKYEETAKLRHDMKNHLSCLLEMAEQGGTDEIVKYLRSLTENNSYNVSSYIATKRKVLCAVINSKLNSAEHKGINTKCIISDEMENIEDADIGILLANLFDNAIEACEKNKGHSEINLKMWSEAGYYCLELNNTVETDVLTQNPTLETSKKDKKIHGVGLKSVRDITEKYNGIFNYMQRNNKFCVYVFLERQSI